MVHLIIINWFDRSGIWIWNRFRVRFNCKLWRTNVNITIINEMMIKSLHDSWNHRTDFGRRSTVFEVIFWRLTVPLFWQIIWFINMKGVDLVHIYYKNWLEEVMAPDNSDTRLISNHSTVFANNLLSKAEICNDWLDNCCIVVGGRWRNKNMIDLTWSGKCIWGSKNF